MTAADVREELEAAVRLAITRNGKCKADGRCKGCESNIDDALALGDAYATAVASETTDAIVRAARQRDRRDTLDAALREAS
jgi:hypothetical protein